MTEEEKKIFEILFPYACSNQKRITDKKIPFVHYTSAAAAMSIIQNKKVWMRESSCMNDKSELEHGLRCLYLAYRQMGVGELLNSLLGKSFPNLVNDVEKAFNSWSQHFMTNTYLSCFSEHDEKTEDNFGRLSMWRAYSKGTGVALVLNSEAFFGEHNYFDGLYINPVAYLSEQGFELKLKEILDNINNNRDFVVSCGEKKITHALFRALMFATICTKHIGFREELEWRLTYCPSFEECTNIKKSLEVINGMPQIVHKIPIEPVPEFGLDKLELDKFIKRIIIGPTDYPMALHKAFMDILASSGVSNPEDRIVVSDIPLRH